MLDRVELDYLVDRYMPRAPRVQAMKREAVSSGEIDDKVNADAARERREGGKLVLIDAEKRCYHFPSTSFHPTPPHL